MQKKPVVGLFGSILSLVLLSSSVAAVNGSPFSGIWDMIKSIFRPFLGISITAAEPITLKLLLGLLIFPILGYAASFAFRAKPKIGWIAAAILTIISVMAIPEQVIRGIA
ncbi:hypothetical protein HY488_01110 [Candidatus Woesearchaeota archaeon]|nr:hypothetical protein [Candidatus Woesearchaeota archaeon]